MHGMLRVCYVYISYEVFCLHACLLHSLAVQRFDVVHFATGFRGREKQNDGDLKSVLCANTLLHIAAHGVKSGFKAALLAVRYYSRSIHPRFMRKLVR